MIIKHLLDRTEYEHLNLAILKLYPKEEQRLSDGFYRMLWDDLQKASEVENENNMMVHVQYVKEHEKVEQYIWNATYSMNRRLNHQYGLHFASKEQIVSSFVYDEDLRVQSEAEYLAHIFFDIAREGQMEEHEDGIGSVEPKNHLPYFNDTVD